MRTFLIVLAVCASLQSGISLLEDQSLSGASISDIWKIISGLTTNRYSWVDRNAGTLPYLCNFVYAGGSNRLLYVGRVSSGKDIIPAAIHHYGVGGTETVRYINNGIVQVQTQVQWLCGNSSNVAWLRVKDLTPTTLKSVNAIPIGYNSTSRTISYGCLVHSFYSDLYPASLGTIKNGSCEFEVKGTVVDSKNFNWWHTLEVLASVF